MNSITNPIGLDGIEFVEFAAPNDFEADRLEKLFLGFGFSKLKTHPEKNVDYFNQGDIHFLLNRGKSRHASGFSRAHGPSICSMGWRVENPDRALAEAKKRGARICEESDFSDSRAQSMPSIYGIGDSLIYFVDKNRGESLYNDMGFLPHSSPRRVTPMGFTLIDHLTNNVEKGSMQKWADFYKQVFGFTEVRYFDIRGAKTGLKSYALRSPCGKFCIPINEGTENKSQINEYLREYKGPGIQHLAFLTENLIESLDRMQGSGIETLDIDDLYYSEVFDRVPNVTEDRQKLRQHQILIDGDEEGYLLQIFTKNLIGPIFIELIQRKNHLSFGEGNFGALFRSIERDQEKRGVL